MLFISSPPVNDVGDRRPVGDCQWEDIPRQHGSCSLSGSSPRPSEWLKISPVTSSGSPNRVSTSHDVTERKKPDPNSDASDDGLL